jgi:PHP family Zn ribbon phosphoesterase
VRRFKADLHVHTALSPCAADDMTPPAIVEAALKAGLEMIGICDHNAAGNVLALQAAAADRLAVVPGIEITTAEEAHVLGLFPNAHDALHTAAVVASTLPHGSPPSPGFGRQWRMSSTGAAKGLEAALLSAASSLCLSEVVALVRRHGGLAIAAHVDRPSFSVPGQLGTMPADTRFDGVEVSVAGWRAGKVPCFAGLGVPVLVSSDSHSLEEIGVGCVLVEAADPSFDELVLALQGRLGRGVVHA